MGMGRARCPHSAKGVAGEASQVLSSQRCQASVPGGGERQVSRKKLLSPKMSVPE